MRVLPLKNYTYSIKNQNIVKAPVFKGEDNDKDFFIEYYGGDNATRGMVTLYTGGSFFNRSFNEYNISILKELLDLREKGDKRFEKGSSYDKFYDVVLTSVENDNQAALARHILYDNHLMNNKNVGVYARSIIKASKTPEQANLAAYILSKDELIDSDEFMSMVPKIIGLTKGKTQLGIKKKAINSFLEGGKFSERKIVEGRSFKNSVEGLFAILLVASLPSALIAGEVIDRVQPKDIDMDTLFPNPIVDEFDQEVEYYAARNIYDDEGKVIEKVFYDTTNPNCDVRKQEFYNENGTLSKKLFFSEAECTKVEKYDDEGRISQTIVYKNDEPENYEMMAYVYNPKGDLSLIAFKVNDNSYFGYEYDKEGKYTGHYQFNAEEFFEDYNG